MENKMETAIQGLGFRAQGLGCTLFWGGPYNEDYSMLGFMLGWVHRGRVCLGFKASRLDGVGERTEASKLNVTTSTASALASRELATLVAPDQEASKTAEAGHVLKTLLNCWCSA